MSKEPTRALTCGDVRNVPTNDAMIRDESMTNGPRFRRLDLAWTVFLVTCPTNRPGNAPACTSTSAVSGDGTTALPSKEHPQRRKYWPPPSANHGNRAAKHSRR